MSEAGSPIMLRGSFLLNELIEANMMNYVFQYVSLCNGIFCIGHALCRTSTCPFYPVYVYKNFIGQLMIPSSGILEYWSSPSTLKSFVFLKMTRITVSIALDKFY